MAETWCARALKLGLKTMIRLYQCVFSPFLSPCCRFYPSCSAYALQVLATHRFGTGVWLILKRLMRCQPFATGGLDPVPIPQERAKNTSTH